MNAEILRHSFYPKQRSVSIMQDMASSLPPLSRVLPIPIDMVGRRGVTQVLLALLDALLLLGHGFEQLPKVTGD